MADKKRELLKEIFDAALRQEPGERQKFVNENCGSDETLRAEIESLLSSFDNAENFMQGAAIDEVADVMLENNRLEKEKCLGHYEIIRQIGAGGMGEVYLARDKKLDRRVAVKILSEKFSRHEVNRSRFIQEAKAASALNHPNILIIHEIGETGDVHFIVSEYIEGRTLREIITDAAVSPLGLNEILEISIQIANALAAAHAARLVHRDIKPENIIIRPDRLVKILDFGLAKLVDLSQSNSGIDNMAADRNETAKGIIVGTVKYMSPEQARGEKVDARTDIFSLGIVIYEMIAGRTPFGCESISETWTKLLHTEPAPLSDFAANVPPELQRIVSRMLEKTGEERYQTVTELLADLTALKRRPEFTAAAEFERENSFEERDIKKEPTERFTGERELQIPVTAKENSKTAAASGGNAIPGRQQKTPPNNLTENLLPIVGREKEIAEICSLLRKENRQMITMTGVGGTGKTRLAQAIGKRMLPEFDDGVFFVKLASITNHELVASIIAQTLGVKQAGGNSLLRELKDHLREKRILIIIDNFEQVIDAAPQIGEMFSEAEHLKILITSRKLLHISAEREFTVPPLSMPSVDAEMSPEELSNYEAIKLFIERAQEAKPNFTLTGENAGSVTGICRKLDGLPLAIELAAVRVKILSPPAILAKLENRLGLLKGGAKDLPARRQTMRGAVEWSYDLLTDDEKRLFRQLAVFAGGFLFDTAEMIIGSRMFAGDNGNKQDDAQKTAVIEQMQIDILDGITSLVDSSLLVSKNQADDTIRFRMLEVVREYGLEALEASGEADSTRLAHAVYFLSLGEEAEPHLQGAESVKWLNRLEEEHDNLRAALRWSLKHDVKIAARLAAAIRHLWAVHAHLTEGRKWLEAVLERDNGVVPQNAKFKVLNWLGLFALHQGDYDKAYEVFEEALAAGKAAGDWQQIATVSRLCGGMTFQQGDLAAAKKFYEEGLEISRELKDMKGVAYSLVFLGDIARVEGDLAAARPLFEESHLILQQLGDRQATSVNLCNMGTVAYLENDFAAALSYYAESLTLAVELTDKQAISYALDGFAALAAERGSTKQAAQLAGAAERLRESIDSEPELAERRFRDAYLARLRAGPDQADFIASYERGRKLTMEEIMALQIDLIETLSV